MSVRDLELRLRPMETAIIELLSSAFSREHIKVKIIYYFCEQEIFFYFVFCWIYLRMRRKVSEIRVNVCRSRLP